MRPGRVGEGAPCRVQAGFTLLELLTVLGLFAILLGIGVGAFRKVSLGRSLAVAQVKDAVRAARVFAVEQSSAARVEVDAEAGTIQASGFVSTGNWHLEDDISRGWPSNGQFLGDATLIEDGAIGRGVRLGDEPPGTIDLGRSVSFDSDRGLRLEVFVRLPPPPAPAGGTLISKGKAFALMVLEGGILRARVRVVATEASGPLEQPFREVEAEEVLPTGRWVRVGMTYDGDALRLLIGPREVAIAKNDESLYAWPDPKAPLLVGSESNPFVGDVDEIRLSSIVIREAPPLPDGVLFGGTGTIHFDGRGRLDSARHSRPVAITLKYDDGRRNREVVVGLLGEIR